ncbi:MAG: hypothetical protein C4342_06445 [Armatimonadota bacterium]
MWSQRLRMGVQHLGAEALLNRPDAEAEVAIVNLAEADATTIRTLKRRGCVVIGHAGHKEKQLIEYAKAAGCDRIVTNGALTHNLERILKEATGARQFRTDD